MDTTVIYGPIQKDMLIVEEHLQSVACVEFPVLAQLLSHVLHSRGKRIRPALTLLVAKSNHYDPDLLIPIAVAVEVLHTATLVHDDLIDNASTRRGKPTLNSAWNGGSAVLSGDYLFAKSAEFASRTNDTRVVRLFAHTIMTICTGELRQMFGGRGLDQSKADYFKKIECKTAALFAAATESGAILSGASEAAIAAYRDYGMSLGMAFQIVDDILDFIGNEHELGKPVGNDLLQGTVTLPAFLLAERYPDDFDLRAVLGNGKNPEAVKRAVEMVRNSSVVDDSYAIARRYANASRDAILSLPSSPYGSPLLELADYVLERRA